LYQITDAKGLRHRKITHIIFDMDASLNKRISGNFVSDVSDLGDSRCVFTQQSNLQRDTPQAKVCPPNYQNWFA